MLNAVALFRDETAEQACWRFTENISMNWEYGWLALLGHKNMSKVHVEMIRKISIKR